jgi:ATP-dependent Clp protease, protease subunit
MEGQIYINGLIGQCGDVVGVEVIDIYTQVKKQPLATSFKVFIKSEGGVVDTGFEIYDYLKSLNVPITTIADTIVASISTVIFMAGGTRIIKPNTDFMVHMPSGKISGNADEISAYGNEVKLVEKRLINFYKEVLNISEEAIVPILRNETFLTNEQAIALGFTNTEVTVEPIMARAIFNINKKENEMITKDDLKEFFEPVLTLLQDKKKGEITSLMVTDANAVVIEFPQLDDLATPTEGDEATVNGVPAEGDYIMPDGATLSFSAGKLTGVAQPEPVNTIDAKDAEIADLKAKLELATATLETTTSQLQINETLVEEKEAEVTAMKTAVVALKSKITSKLDLDEKKTAPIVAVADVVEEVSRTAGMLERLKSIKK